MTDHEKRDVYIAFGIGGIALILILLYVFGGTANPVTEDGAIVPYPDKAYSPYDYNIQPYQSPGAIGNPTPKAIGNGGCCDACGPYNGATYNNVNTYQFKTLLGYGGDLLAYAGAP
jgi:hypothetical protein